MAAQKQNPFVNLVKTAVGLPTAPATCCGFRPQPAAPQAEPCCDKSAEEARAEDCGCSAQEPSMPTAGTCGCDA